MDSFYKSDSNVLSDLVEKLKPSFEHSPVRKDYQVAKFKVWWYQSSPLLHANLS